MTRMDIGIDFTSEQQPSRSVRLTDWEARLVEHCLGLYLAAAEAIDDVTVPLSRSALLKVQLAGRFPGSSRNARRRRSHEMGRLREEGRS